MKTVAAIVALAALSGSAFATAIDIPVSSRSGDCNACDCGPGSNNAGLNGKGWNAASTDLAWLRMKVGTTNNWSFMDRNVHSPNEADGLTGAWPGLVKDFLGSDASMYTGPASQMAKGITMQWKGYLCIAQSGTFTMGAFGDGVFEVKLGGKSILTKGADGAGADTQLVRVAQAGLYEIEVDYSNPNGAAGMNLLWSRAGSGHLSGCDVPSSVACLNLISANAFCKTIPTPGAAAVLGLGGLVAARRRRA